MTKEYEVNGMTFTEIRQTPKEKAITTYNYCNEDLAEGLNYVVDKKINNDSMEAIGSDLRVDVRVTNQQFCEDFYHEFHRLKEQGKC